MRYLPERKCKTKECTNLFRRTSMTRRREYCDECKRKRDKLKGERLFRRYDIEFPDESYSVGR